MGKAHQKSIIREVIERLDSLMVIGKSRGEAKREAKATGESTFAFTTGKIHSYKTRQIYQEHAIHFVKWARTTHGIKRFADLEARTSELVCAYLDKNLAEQKSPFTLQTIRSALRMLFEDRRLASEVELPKRERRNITRSRGPKKHDRHFQPKNWPELVNFLEATGLRRDEVRMLVCGDIVEHDSEYQGQTTVKVRNGKGGKERTVPVDPERVQDVLRLKVGRSEKERVFAHIPRHLDVHSYRRAYAQNQYQRRALNHNLPPQEKERLGPKDYDRNAANAVTKLLGHHRHTIILSHYLR